ALFPRSYSPAAEPGPSLANRHANICIKGVTILRVPPHEGTRCAVPPGGPRGRYRGCSRSSGPAATPSSGLGAPRCPQGLPEPFLAHREGQGLRDPPLQALRRDTQLCHQPGDKGKANGRKGDKSQGGITCCRGRFLSALLGCHPNSCSTPDAVTTGWTVAAPALGSSGVTQGLCPAQGATLSQLETSPLLPKALTDPVGS
ncbi:hypothetical protein Nmel_017601, partial [Mimus melanotis]